MPDSASVLDLVTVDVPCEVPWDTMKGDERRRYCGDCKLNVYNLAGMDREDATALVEQNEGRLCVRIHRRPDGTVVTKDCVSVARAIKRRLRWVAAAIVGVLGLSTAGLGASASETGGLDDYRTWERQPFRTFARVLPAGWLPAPPLVEMGIMCPLPPTLPQPAPAPDEGGAEGPSDG